MVPAARHTRLHHVRSEVVGAPVETTQFLGRAHTPAVRRKPRTEHIGDEPQLGCLADGAVDGGRCPHVLRSTDELGMRVAHLILPESSTEELVDEMTSREAMVDLTTPSKRSDAERHVREAIERPPPP